MSRFALSIAAACLALSAAAAAAEVDPAAVEEARAVVDSFQARLKSRLQAAIAEGGPENAIGVCHAEAPEIAEAVSGTTGWRVGRTALRVRNPDNAPTPREREILEAFKARAEAGEPLARLEEAAVIERDGRHLLHYMKAIPTGQVCLACHGSALSPGVTERLEELYPEDQATGFSQGELRGAFTLYRLP